MQRGLVGSEMCIRDSMMYMYIGYDFFPKYFNMVKSSLWQQMDIESLALLIPNYMSFFNPEELHQISYAQYISTSHNRFLYEDPAVVGVIEEEKDYNPEPTLLNEKDLVADFSKMLDRYKRKEIHPLKLVKTLWLYGDHEETLDITRSLIEYVVINNDTYTAKKIILNLRSMISSEDSARLELISRTNLKTPGNSSDSESEVIASNELDLSLIHI
eukprot:TRINITY_DN14680_c0_g1_i7.p2 TRINITY_DN14680_c0_g1~~TRINITY_DN14680_c0_g1_i7.p2  ORF type:complete len:215 (-),score=36.66 TRINITY_DN14680_c0_g1_i7:172-816(-)